MTKHTSPKPDDDAPVAEPKPNQRPASKGGAGIGTIAIVSIVSLLIGGILGFAAGDNRIATYGPPSASVGPPSVLALGETAEVSSGAEVTVFSWEKGTPKGWGKQEGGVELSSALVRFCAAPGGWNYAIKNLPLHFNLVDGNGTLLAPITSEVGSLDELQSYNVGLLSSDQCVTGTVVFPATPGIPMRAVRFSGLEQFEWDIEAIDNGSAEPPDTSGIDLGVSQHGTEVVV